jgi:hypothetical protein
MTARKATPAAKKAATKPAVPLPQLRGSVQTVRMDAETLKALKYASIERNVSQNDLMLQAIRRDLGFKD